MEYMVNFVSAMNAFGRIEFFLFLLAMIFYIGNMAKNKDFVPNPVAFGIWLLADIVNYITYVSFSEYWIGPLIMAVGSAIVVLWGIIKISFSKKKKRISFSSADWFAIAISVISMFIYFVTSNGKMSNILIQVVMTMGFVPIVSDILKKKQSKEPLWPWIFFSLGWIVTMIDTLIGYQSVVEVLYPFVSLFGCGGILGLTIFFGLKFKQGCLSLNAGCLSTSFFIIRIFYKNIFYISLFSIGNY